jgi:uncharacterized protein
VSVFADSSALVGLYVDEAGHESVRAIPTIAVSQLARVEVPAAFWRKHRIGEIDAEDARLLTAEFEADYFGTLDEPPRFAVVAVTPGVLDEAARLCGRFPLRAYDAVQLGSALLAHAADPALSAMAVFDTTLRSAAAVEGLAVSP